MVRELNVETTPEFLARTVEALGGLRDVDDSKLLVSYRLSLDAVRGKAPAG